MLNRSVPFALISMATVPFMALATVWFSHQARKAFRKARREIGEVNADLQENIAGVREAQAFSREDENIARFRQANAANRDANIRRWPSPARCPRRWKPWAMSRSSIVAGVGGIMMLREQDLLAAR